MRGLISGGAMHALLAGAAFAGIVDPNPITDSHWPSGDFVVFRHPHTLDAAAPATELLVLRADEHGGAAGADGRGDDRTGQGDISLRRVLGRMGRSGAPRVEFAIHLDITAPDGQTTAAATVRTFEVRVGDAVHRLADAVAVAARPDVVGELRFVFEADVPAELGDPASFDIAAEIEAPPGTLMTWFIRGEGPGQLDASGGGGLGDVPGGAGGLPPGQGAGSNVRVGAPAGGGGGGRSGSAGRNVNSFIAGPREPDAARSIPFDPNTEFMPPDPQPARPTDNPLNPGSLADDPPASGQDDSLIDLLDPEPPIAVSPPRIEDEPAPSLDNPGNPALPPLDQPVSPRPTGPRPPGPGEDPSPPSPEPATAWLMITAAAAALRRRRRPA